MRDAVDVDDGVNLLPLGTQCCGARDVEEFETLDGTLEKTEPSEGVVKFRRFGPGIFICLGPIICGCLGPLYSRLGIRLDIIIRLALISNVCIIRP